MPRIGELSLLLDIDPQELSLLVERDGVAAELRRGLLCPCAGLDRREPRIGCPTCRGIGYFHPVGLREPVIVLITSRSAKQAEAMAGRIWQGQGNATFPLGIIPQRGDIIVPENEEHVVNEQLHRAIERLDPAIERTAPYTEERWQVDDPPRGGVPTAQENLLYSDITQIEVVAYDHGKGDDRRSVIAPPALWRHEGRRVLWKEGCGPEPGRGYTVRYRAPAQYILGDAAPAVRVQANVAMPYKAAIERLDRRGDPDLRE